MSRTRKDNLRRDRALKIVQREDNTFDLFLDGELDRSGVAEQWLAEELCVRFGFCGEEYDSILKEVNENGHVTAVY